MSRPFCNSPLHTLLEVHHQLLGAQEIFIEIFHKLSLSVPDVTFDFAFLVVEIADQLLLRVLFDLTQFVDFVLQIIKVHHGTITSTVVFMVADGTVVLAAPAIVVVIVPPRRHNIALPV